jgi:nitrite reductase/ring-hydroxylating ferredoxin subunit
MPSPTPEGPLQAPRDVSVVVLDAESAGAIELTRSLRDAHPEVVIAAHLGSPDRRLWEQIERAGADLVASRGAIGRSLRDLLAKLDLHFALFDAAEIAGRLALIAAVEDSPVGPVAVYRTQGRLACVGDVCPHQGARLSQGSCEDNVVTCPAHGSQFDTTTGERLRGPADVPLKSYRVVEEAGRVWLLWT